MSHGTASSYEIGQFLTVSTAVSLALPKALDGIDPKTAIRTVANSGQALELHLRRFFDPSTGQPKQLRPCSIVRLPSIPVNHDCKWEEGIELAGPNTRADWDVRKVGDLYVAERKGIVLTDITLVNFGEDVGSEQVINFGREWNLGRVIDPRECFAIAEHFPKLHTSPGFFDQMAIVSLKDCVFRGSRRVCCVWFGGQGRERGLDWFGGGWGADFWFGFVRES